ncbi:MAG: MerR family transcriptional regulator [Gammaproteobacteria bacterium]|nr:MerR family transcriptional regulator [Gammaproteobacteria bacterium]
MAKNQKHESVYGIGAVARLTGLTDHAIRVWERRYGAVVARRAPNGRREYTTADVEKLRLLKRLTDEGIAISQIANDDVAELRELAGEVGEAATATTPTLIRVAVLGDLLPSRLEAWRQELAPIDVRVSDSNRDRFAADLRQHDVDVLILETPVLDEATLTKTHDFMRDRSISSGVLLYGFGRTADVQSARDSGIKTLRSPADVTEIRDAVIRCFVHEAPAAPVTRPTETEQPAHWDVDDPVAPRRFNAQQLSNLASITSSIDCECPQHLAQLVTDLSAFEIYSANCVSRGDEDEALHRYLHKTTAAARAVIEEALERVAKAENLDY